MNTCGLCGSELEKKYCNFCEMELEDRYIMQDGKRLNQTDWFFAYPDESEVFSTTKELMEKETLDLLCLLREARKMRADIYHLRKLRHDAEEQSGYTEDVKALADETYSEYEQATRKVWVIENLIKDRLGYYPKRVTNNFLNMYYERMQASEEKVMKLKK